MRVTDLQLLMNQLRMMVVYESELEQLFGRLSHAYSQSTYLLAVAHQQHQIVTQLKAYLATYEHRYHT